MQEDMDDESVDDYYDIIKKMVASEDDGFDFYNNYALEKGFSVRKSYVEWDFGDVVTLCAVCWAESPPQHCYFLMWYYCSRNRGGIGIRVDAAALF
jgi:zinc finger SWIM domain-containing protein 3